jgi:hypothetical protein
MTDDEILIEGVNEGADRERQLVELVRLDYDATLRAVNGFVTTGSQLRGIGVAAWGIVLGLAVSSESVALAILAAAVTAVFAYLDAYHSALYRRALARAISLEGLLDTYLDRLGIDAEDPEAILRARAKLETHRFGMHRSLAQPGWKDLHPLRARPYPVFRAGYPLLLISALLAAIVFAIT